MSSRSLAQVELQLIMRMCDLKSLLSFARCSTDTLKAASNDFAWSSLSPIIFRSTRPKLAENISKSLLRFADIGVRWCHPEFAFNQPSPSKDEVVDVASIPRVALLDTRDRWNVHGGPFAWMVALPSKPLHRLATFYARRNLLTASSFRVLSDHCPLLRTLQLFAPDRESDFIQELAKLSGLTDLDLESEAGVETLKPIFTYSGLIRLRLCSLSGSAWMAFLTSPIVHSLQELTLSQVIGNAENNLSSPIDWGLCWHHLGSLRSLTLENCKSIDALLLSLANPIVSASPLSLCIRIASDGFSPIPLAAATGPFSSASRCGFPLPSLSVLEDLLSKRSNLTVTIELNTLQSYVQARQPMGLATDVASVTAEWEQVYAPYSSLSLARTCVHFFTPPTPADNDPTPPAKISWSDLM